MDDGLYAVYDGDGRIIQANRVYGQKGYGKLLADHAMPYAFNEKMGIVNDNHWYVGNYEELRQRPILQGISINKLRVKAGGDDVAVIKGVPPHAYITGVMTDGTVIWPRFLLDAREFEVPVYSPCTVMISIDLWPYQTYTFTIEGY